MRHKNLIRLFYALGLLALLAASFALGLAQGARATVGAQADTQAPADITAPDAVWLCDVDAVAVIETRIHVRCGNIAPNNVKYFAYATGGSQAANANRFLAIANSAYALGDRLYVHYYSSTASNPPGCFTTDCRGFYVLEMIP